MRREEVIRKKLEMFEVICHGAQASTTKGRI